MEGLYTKLECETEEEDCPIKWLKNGIEINDSSEKMEIYQSKGRLHTLSIPDTSIEDSGNYSIIITDRRSQILGRTCSAIVDVKGNLQSGLILMLQLNFHFCRGLCTTNICRVVHTKHNIN